MAGYNDSNYQGRHHASNGNGNGFYNQQQYDGYVNFDQFVSQHNIRQYYNNSVNNNHSQTPYGNYFSVPPSPLSQVQAQAQSQSQSQQQQQQQFFNQMSNNTAYYDESISAAIPRQTFGNSNLAPTAMEFIPRRNYSSDQLNVPTSSQHQDYFQSNLSTPGSVTNMFPISQSHERNSANRPVGYNEYELGVGRYETSGDKLLAALSSTHINESEERGSGRNTGGRPKSGSGAIKKHQYGNGGYHQMNGTQSSRSESGRAGRFNRKENREYDLRRGGSGRTMSQYDDGYLNKYNLEAFNDKNSENGDTDDGLENRNHIKPNFGINYKKDENGTRDRHQRNYQEENSYGRRSGMKHLDFKINRNLTPTPKVVIESDQCSQREKLIQEIERGKLECLVCCENIKPFQSIWSCGNCYHIIHFNCVVKWASSSKSESGWRCPACQNITKKVPHDSYCFCGKQKDPQYNRNDVAHTCGEVCGKMDGCDHPCTLLCHPGPCPPCQATVTRKCGCGRTQKTMQCCQVEELQCEAKCEKLLNCHLHECTETCHKGDCPDCENKVEHRCFCGKDKREVLCTEQNNEETRYSCGKICNRTLSCKSHKCKDICHSGDCGKCKLSPDIVTSCPCGKVPILSGQRQSCSEPVPLCENVCGKPLKCGAPSNPHKCTNKCHNGNCSTCPKETAVKCRCGHMDQMVKCRLLSTRADDARCKKRCAKKRNCGKHKCNQECCIDIDHVCPLPCNHNLSCGKHKCDRTCHKGRCAPCYRSSFDELYCECGANVIYPPVPCGTKRPACDRPCSRSHLCEHQVQHNCHSAATCPPCMAFTTKYCHGKHEQRKTIPCSQGEFSCGLPCNKPVRCGQHKCIKPCHAGECEKDGDICKQNCPKQRILCTHSCNAPCHTGDCPDTLCREIVEVSCSCGNLKKVRPCHEILRDIQRQNKAKLAALASQDIQEGSVSELGDVLAASGKQDNSRILECNDECKLLERNRRLDIAFRSSDSISTGGGSSTSASSKVQTKYSDFIKGWAKKDANLVGMIHDKLTELVKLAKENKQRSRSHSFPVMNREKRQLVHEMCEMFGVESVAYDAEPNRNVVATATKDNSWFPAMSIFDVLQRESGQRRIPVPNNNAWGLAKR